MPSKKEEDGGESLISPVLFMTVDGEPMHFFLRPGPAKVQLLPRIKAGGGMVCKAQQPGAILLADPEEVGSFPESTAHWYVSTQYIQDCIEKNLQLDVEDYRISPESVQRRSTRQNTSKQSFGSPGGRVAYSSEEDAAILRYVSKHKTEVGGNRLWQEMAKKNVTNHSWQSMKSRYKTQLAHRQLEVEEEEETEGEDKVEDNQETHIEKPSCDKDDLPPQTSSSSAETAATDLTQTDAQPMPAESTQPEPVEAQTSSAPQQEAPCLHPQMDAQPIPAETTQPEPVEPPVTSSSDPEVMPEDSPPAQSEALPDTPPSQNKQKKKEMASQPASPTPVQPQRRSARRQLEPEEPPPSPPGVKLRSSSLRSPQKAASSPQPSKKTRPTDEAVLQEATSVDQPSPKRARRDSGPTVPENEEKVQATPSEKTQAGEEGFAVTQNEAAKGGKKKEKRKLGILEMATKEFEDQSESDQEENTDVQKPAETEAIPARPTETPLPTSATAATAAAPHPGPGPGPGPGLQECNHRPEAACPLPAVDQQIPSTSKAHLFIFESESQEEESQSIIDKNTAAPSVSQLATNKDAAISLTQVQLEEDKQRIRGLMKKTNQDLVSVTKALLKTSGDFSAALRLLLNPSSIPGLFWNRRDDSLLLSADPVVRQQLQEKYGEEDVARRLMFLEVE